MRWHADAEDSPTPTGPPFPRPTLGSVRMVSKTLYKKPNIIAFYKELHKGK